MLRESVGTDKRKAPETMATIEIKLPLNITFHAVLAGAYKGKRANLKILLNHASLDDGETALCGKVQEGSLCDMPETEATCPACLKKLARIAKPDALGF